MKKPLFLFFTVLFLMQISNAQETYFQTGHTNDILEVHFSPDDSQLVSYSAGDGNFILWDVKSGQQIWTRETSFIRKAKESINLKEFYWSKDSKTLVTKSANGTYQTWDAQTGKVLALTETKPEVELIAPNKREVSYTKDYDNITIADSQSSETKAIKRFGNNSAFDTSNNGEMIAEGGSWGDTSIRITEIKTGKSWWLDGHPSVIGGIAFTPDGKFIAVGGSDKIIYIFDAKTHALVKRLAGHTKPVNSLAFSPDGKVLLSSGDNETMKIWNWQEDKFLQDVKSEEDIFGVDKVSFSADGRYFLTTSDRDEFRLWDAKTFKIVRNYKTAEKYESSNGEMTIGYDAVPVSSANFSNDGQKIVSVHKDDSVRIWNVGDGKQIKKLKTCEGISFAAFSKDDKRILAYCDKEDKEQIKIFDANTGREIFHFYDEETGFIKKISISPNGKNFVTSDVGGDILLWNINKSESVREFDIGFSGDDAIAFSPDGKTFAVGGRNQNLFLFDVETGEKLWQLISSYQPSELEIQLEERGKKEREEVTARKAEREKQAEREVPTLAKKITAKFSHYGDAESFWDQKIAESGAANKSKLKLPKEKAKVAWFTLTNDADLPVSIDTNSVIFNPKCKGLCDGAEISSRYVLELKSGETSVNGFDMFSKTILPPKRSVYFSVGLEDFAESKAIYLGFTFQKDNADDENSNDYGTEQKLYLRETELPK